MRAFTGIDLPDQVKESISMVQSGMPPEGITPVRKDALHITLHFFENITKAQCTNVMDAIAKAGISKFRVRVKGVAHFGGSQIRVVYAWIDDTEGKIPELYEKIGDDISKHGIYYDKKERFIPHITIARCRSSGMRLRKFIEENSDYDFGEADVENVFLKNSVLSSEGPAYTTLFDHKI